MRKYGFCKNIRLRLTGLFIPMLLMLCLFSLSLSSSVLAQSPDTECTVDAECEGLKICNKSNFCLCQVNCGPNKTPNLQCETCVCKTECSENEKQLSDCSCVAATEDLVSDTEKIKLNIFWTKGDLTMDEVDELDIGDKIVLTYRIDGSFLVKSDKVNWQLNGSSIGKGNSVAYVVEESGDKTISLLYDDQVKDEIKFEIAGVDDGAEDFDEATQAKVQEIAMYIIGGVLALVALVFLIYAIFRLVKAIKHKRHKNTSNNQNKSDSAKTSSQPESQE
jgi:hypothetical protein